VENETDYETPLIPWLRVIHDINGTLNSTRFAYFMRNVFLHNNSRLVIGNNTNPQTQLEVEGTMNASSIKVGQTNVCLQDGTNCASFVLSSDQYTLSNLSASLGAGDVSSILTSTITTDTAIVNKNLYVIGNISNTNITHLNVNGSLYPSIDAQFDIGNGTLRWRNANFSGILSVGTLSSGDLFANNINSSGDLNVGSGSPPSISLYSDGTTAVLNASNTVFRIDYPNAGNVTFAGGIKTEAIASCSTGIESDSTGAWYCGTDETNDATSFDGSNLTGNSWTFTADQNFNGNIIANWYINNSPSIKRVRTDRLFFYYNFDDIDYDTITDLSDQNVNLKVNGLVDYSDSIIGYCVNLKDLNSYISSGNMNALSEKINFRRNNFTLSF
jgi:hypothetical protein